MELAQEKLDLIEKIIKNNKKFVNNEDLYDDFFNETCKRSFLIVKTVSSDAALEAYLRKIASTSILNVLKNEGRLRRTKDGYTPTNTTSLDAAPTVIDYSKVEIIYEPMDINNTPEDSAIQKEILQKIVDTVTQIDKEFPEKNYLQIYFDRYEKGMTQNEIAEELNLSQSEVSKRLFKLMDKVKKEFGFINNEMPGM